MKTAYATRLLFNVASNATMMSLLIFYYRLVDQAHIQWFRYLLWAAIAFNLVTWFVFFMSQVLICMCVFHAPAERFMLINHQTCSSCLGINQTRGCQMPR